jgi:hypothetical protein
MKLTKPQRELLRYLCTRAHQLSVSPSYKPARKLVELGLAELREQRLGNPILVVTDLGRSECK